MLVVAGFSSCYWNCITTFDWYRVCDKSLILVPLFCEFNLIVLPPCALVVVFALTSMYVSLRGATLGTGGYSRRDSPPIL